jgi:hypothetical protein
MLIFLPSPHFSPRLKLPWNILPLDGSIFETSKFPGIDLAESADNRLLVPIQIFVKIG